MTSTIWPLLGYIIVDNEPDVQPGISYHGIDRNPWRVLFEGEADGTLPQSTAALFRAIQTNNDDFSGICIEPNFDVARQLLQFSKTRSAHCDLIGVGGPTLQQFKKWGHLPRTSRDDSSSIGFDIFAAGEWSLIKACYPWSGPLEQWKAHLNHDGLFHSPDAAMAFATKYKDLALADIVEPIADDERLPVFVVQVYSELKQRG